MTLQPMEELKPVLHAPEKLVGILKNLLLAFRKE